MTHKVVQYRVDGSGDVVERAGHVEQVVVDGLVVRRLRAVDEEQPLEVERRPAHEEGHYYCGCGQTKIYSLVY